MIIGAFWDFELSMSMALTNMRAIGLGHVQGEYGAAKLTTSDSDWFLYLQKLAQSAAAIVVVPLDRPATLLEVRHILANRDLTSKTIFLMPPTNLHFSALLKRLWRISIGRSWRAARGKLVAEGLTLPEYSRKGSFIFVDPGSGECHPAPLKDCNADYLRSLVDLASRRRALSPTEFSKALDSRVNTISSVRYGYDSVFSALLALLFALVIRTFLFQPFNIPSGSMKPTLLVGDYLFVSKYPYGYSHYSLPMSPSLFSGRIFGSEPSRGDVVVFRLPKDDLTDYIKRVIGLPGDRIQMREGLLYVNEKPVMRERLSDFVGEDPCGSDATARVKRWKETLPNGVSYETLDCVDNGFYDNTNVYTVPANHFFMMGDNRDNSTDSRMLSVVGYVPFENIVGQAGIVFFSTEEGEHAWKVWQWPGTVRWRRLLTHIR